jgi:Rrf2 family transcriptional regulator, iron-sulfur cluster assembly transcription factor
MLSKTSIHAIRAVVALAELPPDTYGGTAKLAKQISAPPNYLGKLLQQLARSGMLNSQKGLSGGFALARRAEDITLLEVVEALEPVDRYYGCILGRNACKEHDPCPLHHQWKVARGYYLTMLEGTTVSAILSRDLPLW